MILPRYIPPAGTIIKFSELLGWLADTVSGKDRRDQLCNDIKERFGVEHCFLMSSGRAAMAMIFQILKNRNPDRERTEVVLPSYTCYSVPAAAEIAGLKVRICDIDPDTLSYDIDQLRSIDLSQVLCVVTANLYGYPNNLPELEELTHQAGCYLLDDAAQSMNAQVNNRYAGTFGNLGLYSLDKGKNITSIQGGIIVTNDDLIAGWIDEEIQQLPEADIKHQLIDALKLIVYMLMLKPWLYWVPANIPALGLGKTSYTTDYLFSKYSRSMSALASRLFRRIDQITHSRKQRCHLITEKLKPLDTISFIEPVNESVETACLRLPVIVRNSHARDQLVKKLNGCGIGATSSYPRSIADLKETSSFSIIHNNKASGGQYVANHILTLPSISCLNSHDIDVIVSTIKNHS